MSKYLTFALLVVLTGCLAGQDLIIQRGDDVKITVQEVTQFTDGSLVDNNGIIKTTIKVVGPNLDSTNVVANLPLNYTDGNNTTIEKFDFEVGTYQVIWRSNWYVETNPGTKNHYSPWGVKTIKVNPAQDDRIPKNHILILEKN